MTQFRCSIPRAPSFSPLPRFAPTNSVTATKKHVVHANRSVALASSTADDQERINAPWMITFDLRERETIWTDENKARLVAMLAGDELEISRDELDARLRDLTILVPDLRSKIHTMKVKLLTALIRDLDAIAIRLMSLSEHFPNADVISMVAKQPELLLQDPKSLFTESLKVKELLGIESVDELIMDHPMFLDSEAVEEALDHMQTLMPNDDVRIYLLRNPSFLLSVGRGTKRLGDHPDS